MGVFGIDKDLSKRGMWMAASNALGALATGLGNRRPGQSEWEATPAALSAASGAFVTGVDRAAEMGSEEQFENWALERIAQGDVGKNEMDVLRAALSGNRAYAALMPSLLRARSADKRTGADVPLSVANSRENAQIENWRNYFRENGISALDASMINNPGASIYKAMTKKYGSDPDYLEVSRFIKHNVDMMKPDGKGGYNISIEPVGWGEWHKGWDPSRGSWRKPRAPEADKKTDDSDVDADDNRSAARRVKDFVVDMLPFTDDEPPIPSSSERQTIDDIEARIRAGQGMAPIETDPGTTPAPNMTPVGPNMTMAGPGLMSNAAPPEDLLSPDRSDPFGVTTFDERTVDSASTPEYVPVPGGPSMPPMSAADYEILIKRNRAAREAEQRPSIMESWGSDISEVGVGIMQWLNKTGPAGSSYIPPQMRHRR